MKRLALLSPILLAACAQHQDPCVVQRPPCNPLIEDCVCEYSGQDSDRDSSGVGGDRVTPPDGNGGGSEGSDHSDDSNGDVSDHGPSDDSNGDNSSDKNEDRPRKDDKSSDSNGDNSHD